MWGKILKCYDDVWPSKGLHEQIWGIKSLWQEEIRSPKSTKAQGWEWGRPRAQLTNTEAQVTRSTVRPHFTPLCSHTHTVVESLMPEQMGAKQGGERRHCLLSEYGWRGLFCSEAVI